MIVDESMSKRILDEMTEDDDNDNKSDSMEPMVRLRGDWHVSCLETWRLKNFLLVTGCRTWDFGDY